MNKDRLYARAVYYPTLAWNLLLGRVLQVRHWWDEIDDGVILGARPFAKDTPALAAMGVKGVVNTCEEFIGYSGAYNKFQIEQFYMPTVDFTHPSQEDVECAVDFMKRIVASGNKVYVHCKAGRGRSATVVVAYLIIAKGMTLNGAQELVLKKRPHVNRKLTERPVLLRIAAKFKNED